MMPGTLVRPQVAPRNPGAGVPVPVVVGELSATERVVALYASDMPSRGAAGQVEVLAWIEQGAAHLGRAELREGARFLCGWWLLSGSSLASVSVAAAHRARFPKAGRLSQASRLASNLALWGVRAGADCGAQVEGVCACGESGWVALPWGVEAQCPVDTRPYPGPAAVLARTAQGAQVAGVRA
jgi:hypothetical protein